MYGKAEGCSGGRGGSMHLFSAKANFYGGNAIVGGGLPLAVGLALADKMRGRGPRHRLLLRRGRGGRGRVPREPESRLAVGPAGAVRLREQPIRHGHRARALGGGDRHLTRRPRATPSPARSSTAWTSSPSRRRRAARSRRCARRTSPTSSNAAPIGSAPIRCSTPSSIATRRRSRRGARRARSSASRAGSSRTAWSIQADVDRIEAEVEAEIDAAVAFAEAGHLGAARGADPARLCRGAAGAAAAAVPLRRDGGDDLPRGGQAGHRRCADRAIRASS